jgi:hypothetical protein
VTIHLLINEKHIIIMTVNHEYIPQLVAFIIALLIKGTFEHIAATTCTISKLVDIREEFIFGFTKREGEGERKREHATIFCRPVLLA